MAIEICSGNSTFIWREPVASLIGSKKRQELIQIVEAALNTYYPEQAPWKIFTEELTEKGAKDRIYVQVTQEVGKRQPVHWDTAAPWFGNCRGSWAPLSIVLHVNDGLTTSLPGMPLPLLGLAADNLFHGKTAKYLAEGYESVLQSLEEVAHREPPSMSRQGQCLAFHAGEQPHAGMSWDGKTVDPRFPTFLARAVVYFFAVPEAMYETVRDLELFNSEFPEIRESQVKKYFLWCQPFLP